MHTYLFQDNAIAGLPFYPTTWIGGARVANALRSVDRWDNATNKPIGSEADALIDAHRMLAGEARSRGHLVYFDVEIVTDAEVMRRCIEAFAAEAPALRRAGGVPIRFNREDWPVAAKDPAHPMHDDFAKWKPVAELLDYFDVNSYMLGEQYIQRDLDALTALRKLARAHYPACRMLHSLWGNYHTAWDSDTYSAPPIPADVLRRYVNNATRYGDDVILFDFQPERDAELGRLLALRQN